MALRIAVGTEDFDDIRRTGAYYVDKTELIYELFGEANNKVTLFTRPRRFGKTLNMSMLASFFDITRDSSDIFAGLAVTRHPDFCAEWMNRYPVLFLSLKDVEGIDFETAYLKLETIISDFCKKYVYLMNSEKTDLDDRAAFAHLKARKADTGEVQNALKTIMRMMYTVYGKPVILLIDEYDVPLAKANENGYYRQMLDVIRGMLSIALKTNEYLQSAVITGCLRIAKESIFTGVNNFASYSVLDKRFSEYFGFTQDEVDALLKAANLDEKADQIRNWYDGYLFGKNMVYCPWDVVSFVSDLLYSRVSQPRNYWKNTSGNGILRAFVANSDFEVADKFETLLNGGSITEPIHAEMAYDQLYDSESHLWSILLMTGYLTKVDPDAEGGTLELRIPNEEIASIFEDTVVDHFNRTLDKNRLQLLMNSLWNGEEDTASQIMSDLLWDTISYNDYHEDYYHAFLTGLFVGRGYAVESNKEHGLGRPDILLKDRRNRRAIIIEAKRSDRKSELEKDCESGIRQIAEKQYADKLPGYEQIMCYGVAFYQKSALVKRMK